MKNMKLKVALLYNFALSAILLNCVGIFILNLTKYYGISAQAAGWLEPFKDFAILFGSFLLVSYIPKMGYKTSLILGVLCEIVGCTLMAMFPSFMMARIFFVCIGVGFALVKVSAYSSVSLFTETDSEHASFISFLEGFFMFGILAGFWIFAYFMKDGGWIHTFWFLTILGGLGLILLFMSSINETCIAEYAEAEKFSDGYKKMWALLAEVVVWFFLLLALCYLFIEQGVFNFLPLFNNKILHLSGSASVELASLMSAGIGLGRIVFGMLMKYVHWSKVIFVCMVGALVVLLLALHFTATAKFASCNNITHWGQFPVAAYLLPLVGFMVAPVYPTLCSSILSRRKLKNQSAMTVLIIIFSAIGGTLGSGVVGEIFGVYGGFDAFAVFLVPLSILLIFVVPYAILLKKRFKKRQDADFCR